MNELFLGVWQDLREKRMWPVAAGLLVALIAVPFVLVKPAKEVPPQANAADAAASAKRLQPIDAAKALLQPADESVSNGSALEAFLSKDPFKPIKDLRKAAGVAPATITSSGSSGSTASGGSPAGTPSSGGTTTQGGSGGGTSQGRGSPTKTVTTYTYTIDLRFGPSGHEKAYKDVKQLTVLPDERTPLLVFLGVTTDRKKAVFLVDSKFDTSGEGRCKPSTNECTFLYLAQDDSNNEQLFTDVDGTEYTLRLTDIQRTVLDKKGSTGGSGGKPTAGGSGLGSSPFTEGVRTFGFPLFSSEQTTTVQTLAPGSSVSTSGR
jgi:hypothetical protein